MPSPARAIAVLGMHRSGTSCLAGTLEEAGVYLGPVSRQNPHNRKGNHERGDIMALHEAVLAANSAAWHDPPDAVQWSPDQQEERDGIIASFDDAPIWGFKDPRTLLLLDGWRRAVPELEFAGIFRHPLLVAQSLQRRGGTPIADGVALWQAYNDRLLALHREQPFPLIEFTADPAALRASLTRLLDTLGLPLAPERLAFYAPELQHQREPVVDEPLSAAAAATYSYLRERAL